MRTAIFTVVYPGVENYLQDFFSSLFLQDDQCFEIFIINDGIKNLSEWLNGSKLPLHIRSVDRDGCTPSMIRKMGIRWLIEEKIDYIIFADSDDYFASNRIRVVKELLSESNAEAVINELVLFGTGIIEPQYMFRNRLSERQQITNETIKFANCCGLSNTALRLNVIGSVIDQIPDHVIAFDWNLFTRLLIKGVKMLYTGRTYTKYRQHNANIASPHVLTELSIMNGIKIKLEHYKSLENESQEYYKLAEQYASLYRRLREDVDLRGKYLRCVNERSGQPLMWWESIKTIEELAL
jgi:glycosyltransferase involved in cell wall biosynthesis